MRKLKIQSLAMHGSNGNNQLLHLYHMERESKLLSDARLNCFLSHTLPQSCGRFKGEACLLTSEDSGLIKVEDIVSCQIMYSVNIRSSLLTSNTLLVLICDPAINRQTRRPKDTR